MVAAEEGTAQTSEDDRDKRQHHKSVLLVVAVAEMGTFQTSKNDRDKVEHHKNVLSVVEVEVGA